MNSISSVKVIVVGIILFYTQLTSAQWSYTELANMPEPVANNAVVAVEVDGSSFVYSFSGIDSTKLFSGIHKRCFKYDVEADEWTELPELPNGNGRIAAGASVLNGNIYVVGGYEVLENGSEFSIRKMHIFDPVADTFLEDGKDLFYPIDDHVQDVWRDSLLYIVTGWSNFNNVNIIQVYNPSTDSWREAARPPDNNNYKVFGGSGVIIGDTIYYAGGASGGALFPATRFFRKGLIDVNNPVNITWSGMQSDNAQGYRMAASSIGEDPIWLGGSQTTYNYNGIAYNGSGGVEAFGTVKRFDVSEDSFVIIENVFPPTMDFRGLGKISENKFILAGGMGVDQEVSNRTYLLEFDDNSSNIDIVVKERINLRPNPFKTELIIDSSINIDEVIIYSTSGTVYGIWKNENRINWNYGPGAFYVDVKLVNGKHFVHKVICSK